MKRTVTRLIAVLFPVLLLFACGGNKRASIESSGVWSLSERYASTYTTLICTVTYEIDGEPLTLKINRSKQLDSKTRTVLSSKEVDGVVYALCANKGNDDNSESSDTYYEAFTGAFKYHIGRDSQGFRAEDYLDMDDAIQLIRNPLSPRGKIRFTNEEWNGYFRLDGCNLEVIILPNDGGKEITLLDTTYTAHEEGGDTYFTSAKGDEIAYTDGTHSVRIRQANRSGGNAANLLTLEECKAVLKLLG